MDNCTYIKKEVKYPHEEVEANRSDGTTPVINQTFIEDPKEQDYHIKIEEIDIKFEYDCSRLEDYQNSLNNGNESFETPSLNHLHQNITSSNTSSRGASTTEQHSDDCSNRSEVELKTRNTEKKQTWTEWFNCDSCDFKAKQKCYLKCHKLGHKPPSKNERFSCVLCNSKVKHRESFNKRRTLWRDRLKKHMPVHKQSLVDGHSDGLKTKVKGHVSVHKESSVDEHSERLKTKSRKAHVRT
ncbi:hypothetical protein NQ315_007402 [Exocentrus adspersus]|uniref:C2H2-type domain-containing protein n=1 Tax=Exocentrus adspersus TaxID=1586481 RepID=A0AAV8VI76_9CUCU|nr:hypothetical protein NQ315_007402 [Exocentrus adspersus]